MNKEIKKTREAIKIDKPVYDGLKHTFREGLMLGYIKTLNGGKILDAGCGVGSLFFELNKNNDVFGIDISDTSLRNIREEAELRGVDIKDKVKKMNILKTSFPDNFFDCITCGEVLEHVKEDGMVVKEFNRILKNKGICVVSVPANPKLWNFGDDVANHCKRYNKKELIRLFENNGFMVENIKCYGFPIMRLYLKFICLPILRRRLESKEKDILIGDKIKKFNSIYPLLSYIFYFDKLFDWSELGVGLVIKARKI